MRLRSLLFVPGDRPERMMKALDLGADALILDLEDSVSVSAKAAARDAIASFLLSADRRLKLFVRVNPLESAFLDDDLKAILAARPDGIVLPKAEGAPSVTALALKAGEVPILPIATETPAAVFQIGTYAAVRQLLLGVAWGAEDLPAAIGASASRQEDGSLTPPYEMVRSLTLFGGHAAGVPVIETVYPAFKNIEGLSIYAQRARRDGFTGMMAIHPSQVPIINEAFTPSPRDVTRAQAIVDAFLDNPNQGALQLNGQMIDAPHFKQAQHILAMSGMEAVPGRKLSNI